MPIECYLFQCDIHDKIQCEKITLQMKSLRAENEEKYMKDLIACCGLNCEKCDAYNATVNNDDTLREKTAQLWSKMNHVIITADMINCQGCRSDGVKTVYCENMCEIRKCVQKNKFATCGDCPKLEKCRKIRAIIRNYPEALVNLKKITE